MMDEVHLARGVRKTEAPFAGATFMGWPKAEAIIGACLDGSGPNRFDRWTADLAAQVLSLSVEIAPRPSPYRLDPRQMDFGKLLRRET
jgi:hypothetical protein